MLSVKQGNIKYYFLSLWYDSTWDWTLVSLAIGEHSKHYGNGSVRSILPIDWTISGTTTLGQSRLGSNGNNGVFHILQSSSITGASPSDFLVLYPGHSLVEYYTTAEIQSMYSAAPSDWANTSQTNTDADKMKIGRLCYAYLPNSQCLPTEKISIRSKSCLFVKL